ncbi:hypothetical protein C0993_007714 [Termitomyces sp. T159_Od127]|nr:hypothetical protein C0993_007714 [Termitomyces sp. T159_Od127]
MDTEVLLQRLEAVGQPVLPTVLFLQDNLAVMMMEGLLNQIKLMWKQHVLALEQIDCTAKCKLSSSKEAIGELKQARQQLLWLAKGVRAGMPTTSQSVLLVASLLDMSVWPTAISMESALSLVMPVQPTATFTGLAMLLSMPAWPIAASTEQSTVATSPSMALTAPKVLEVQKALVSGDEEMGEVPLTRDKMVPLDAGGTAPPSKEAMVMTLKIVLSDV